MIYASLAGGGQVLGQRSRKRGLAGIGASVVFYHLEASQVFLYAFQPEKGRGKIMSNKGTRNDLKMRWNMNLHKTRGRRCFGGCYRARDPPIRSRIHIDVDLLHCAKIRLVK